MRTWSLDGTRGVVKILVDGRRVAYMAYADEYEADIDDDDPDLEMAQFIVDALNEKERRKVLVLKGDDGVFTYDDYAARWNQA